DYCAANDKQQAYSMLEFQYLDQVLSQNWLEVVRWICDCFKVVPGRVEPLLREFHRLLLTLWMRPIVPAQVQWGDAPREPAIILRELPPAALRARAQMLQGGSGDIARAREWLQAMAAQKQTDNFRMTAPDFFSALPQWALPDNDLRLPRGT